MNKRKGFTLIELLVVVAIIGILAAVGVVAYNGYTSGAKASSTKANFNLVKKFIASETMKCVIGETYIMEKTINCSDRAGSNYVYNDAGAIKPLIIKFFDGKIKNPYTSGNGVVTNGGVPNNDKEIGEVHIHNQSSPERLTLMICFKSPCSNSDNRIEDTLYLPD